MQSRPLIKPFSQRSHESGVIQSWRGKVRRVSRSTRNFSTPFVWSVAICQVRVRKPSPGLVSSHLHVKMKGFMNNLPTRERNHKLSSLERWRILDKDRLQCSTLVSFRGSQEPQESDYDVHCFKKSLCKISSSKLNSSDPMLNSCHCCCPISEVSLRGSLQYSMSSQS